MSAGQAKLPWQLQEECSHSVARTNGDRGADGNSNAKALTGRLTVSLFVSVAVKNPDVLCTGFPFLIIEDS